MNVYTERMRSIGGHIAWQLTPTADHPRLIAEAEGHELFDQPGEANPQGHSMQDHGGPKISAPKLFLIWASGHSAYDKNQFQSFAKDLMENGYFDKISPYTGGSFTGRFLGAVDGPATGSTVSEADALNYVKAAIASGIAPQPDGSTVYSVMLPPGVTATMGSDGSCSAFCAYHSSDGGQILFTLQPDTSCTSCHGPQTAFQAACMVESHEVAELCTDPYGTGWYENATGMENGDIVAWIPLQYGPWTVQGYFGNENGGSNLIGSYHSVPQPPPPGPTLSVSISGPKTLNIGQTATFSLVATGSSSPLYRVDWGDGQIAGWSANNSPSHGYSQAGNYALTALVFDSASGKVSAPAKWTVAVSSVPQPPPPSGLTVSKVVITMSDGSTRVAP